MHPLMMNTLARTFFLLGQHVIARFSHSVNGRPMKRLPLVARLPPAFYTVPHAEWNYGIMTSFL